MARHTIVVREESETERAVRRGWDEIGKIIVALIACIVLVILIIGGGFPTNIVSFLLLVGFIWLVVRHYKK